jgi:molecular chaperone DnaK
MKEKPKIKNTTVVGIDLGTSNTAFAFYEDTGPKVIPNIDGEFTMPSVVHVPEDGSEPLVGASAWNLQLVDPERTFREFKRAMGTSDVFCNAGKKDVTATDLSVNVLKHVSRSLDEHFGEREKRKAVVTVPAYFLEDARQATREAAEKAGFEVLGIINEPTAAAIAYGLNGEQGDNVVLIVDIGGGTTDITIGSKQGGEFEVLATDGDKHLGGKDVDELLVDWYCEEFQRQHDVEITEKDHPSERFTILEEMRRAKHALFARQEITVAARVGGKNLQLTLGRDKLAEMIEPLTDRVRNLIVTAEKASGVNRKELKVLLVGGSTRLMPIREMIKGIFGEDSAVGGKLSPDHAVCLGAAIHAMNLAIEETDGVPVDPDFKPIPAPAGGKHKEATAHGLGVAVGVPGKDERRMSEILTRNSPIPCKATKEYGSMSDTQTEFQVEILQGRENQSVSEALVVGSKLLSLPPRSSKKASLEVTMAYDRNSMCCVTVFDRVSKKSVEITVDFTKKNPSENN